MESGQGQLNGDVTWLYDVLVVTSKPFKCLELLWELDDLIMQWSAMSCVYMVHMDIVDFEPLTYVMTSWNYNFWC